MNILLTGAKCQLGAEIKKRSAFFPEGRSHFFDLPEIDFLKPEKLEKIICDNEITCIINCAAYASVDKAEEETEMAYMINAYALKNLTYYVNRYKLIFVHISSSLVFDGLSNRPYIETDAPAPLNHYGKSKLQGEQIIRTMCPEALIIRTSWLYSSGAQNFVQTIRSLAKMRTHIKMSYDQIGSPTWAGDLAAAILTILNDPQTGISKKGIYHYSNEGIASLYDFAYEIINLSRLDCKLYPVRTKDYPSPAKRPYYSVMSKEKIKSDFGLIIPHWQKSLKKCIEEIKLF